MRQADVIGTTGTTTMKKLRVAVVGAGGTGSHVALALVYLGFTDVLILDDDIVETRHLHRLITATIADIGAPKTLIPRPRPPAVDARIAVAALPGLRPAATPPGTDRKES